MIEETEVLILPWMIPLLNKQCVLYIIHMASTVAKKGRDFWGPPNWDLYHTIGYRYTLDKKPYVIRYFLLLTFLLPCDICRKNLKAKYAMIPPTKYTSSRAKMFMYTYLIHDMANKHITQYKKSTPKYSPSFSSVLKDYRNRDDDVSELVWHIIHIFAATLKYENSEYFNEFLNIIGKAVGDSTIDSSIMEFTQRYPIHPYLRNNNDAFLYSYMMHKHYASKLGKPLPDFHSTKYFYFRSLGEECNDCKV